MKKASLVLIMFIMLSALFLQPALAVVEQSESYYVADYAGVISDTTESDIIAVNGDLEYYCDGAQIVVVTVEYLDGMYSDEYATQLFNDWGVGSADANNGMLLLLATEENKAWLTTGAGISNSFTDDMANQYLDDYFWNDFDNREFNSAVISLFPQLVHWYEGYYDTSFFSDFYDSQSGNGSNNYGDYYFDDYYDESYYNDYSYSGDLSSFSGIISLVIYYIFRFYFIGIIIAVFVLAIISDRRRYRAYYTYMGMPIPAYHFWFMWQGGPHRHWQDPRYPRGPRGPRGPGGGGFGGGGFGGFGGGGFGGGHSGGGFGGGGFGGGGGGGRR